jgi:hypothetical protein
MQWEQQYMAVSTVIQYEHNVQAAFLAILSLPYRRMAEERITKLQKQGHPIPSMGFKLSKVNTGHKHMMFLNADVLFTCHD